MLHVFYQCPGQNGNANLQLHLVVLYQIKYFLWIGSIPKEKQIKFNNDISIYYGKPYEQIFDPFKVISVDNISMPNDVGHLLSQTPTSKYLHCSPQLNIQWLQKYKKIRPDQDTVYDSIEAIVGMKQLMRKMRMEFWIVAGTLLGWLRQCDIIPYTDDSDFATWSKYAQMKNVNLAAEFLKLSYEYSLHLEIEMGQPNNSVEYSFLTLANEWKVDLFFNYPSKHYFRFPLHAADDTYTYQYFPKYKLCSVQLLGYKLLAPCNAEKVIVAGKTGKTNIIY